MAHDARAVANVLIERGSRDGIPLTPLQIIKLVYFCHGWMLGLYEKPLIRQPVEAWRYGPVVRDLYRELKSYGSSPVKSKMGVPETSFDHLEDDLIDQVYSKYGKLSGIYLSHITHAPGTPWHEIWRRDGQNSAIPNDLIKRHYAERAGCRD